MENFLAIFIAVATFIFTLYQWLVSMNSRRPRLIVQGFQPSLLKFSKKFNYLQVFLPYDWFIINASELPNAIINMTMQARIGGRWLQGKFIYYDLWRKDSEQETKKPWPLAIMGHSYFRFERDKHQIPLLFEFAGCPSAQELAKLAVRLEVHDQYGKIHAYSFVRPRHFAEVSTYELPDVYWSKDLAPQVLADVDIPDANGALREIVRIIYLAKYTVNDEPTPSIGCIGCWKYGSYEYITINRRGSSSWQESTQAVVTCKEDFLSDTKSSKILLHLDNKIPKALELEFVIGDKRITKKVDLPSSFVQSLK